MNKIPVIIDTDPGIDDAAALAIALFSEQLDVKLITTVAGNVSIDKVTYNALQLLTFWNKAIPIARGAEKPLVIPFVDAAHVHGVSGLDGFDFPSPNMSLLAKEHAVIKMYSVLQHSTEKITLVPIGPLTNIALLLSLYPSISKKIERIVMMGGSLARGNKTVMAEFNFATDPEAAKIVFNSGIPLVMAGMDLGKHAVIMFDDAHRLQTLNKTGAMLHALFQKYRSGSFKTGLRMYDACAIAYILDSSMFKTQEAFVDIELEGSLTKGCSVVDLENYLGFAPNTTVCLDVDTVQFREWFLNAIEKCS